MSTDQRFRHLSTILNDPPRTTEDRSTQPTEKDPSLSSTDEVHALAAADLSPTTASAEDPQDQPAAPTARSSGGARRVPFRLPAELHQALTGRARAESSTHADIVFDAIETAHANHTLSGLVQNTPDREPGGALFARRRGSTQAQAAVTTEIRVDAASLATLDELVATHDAPNRTYLIVAALTDYLR